MAEVVDTTESTEGAAHIVDLNGEFRFKVDAKGRMSLPAKFRKVLSTDLVVTRNPKDECLYVFEPRGFNAWVAEVFEDKFGKLKARAKDVEVDGSGRIMLPTEAREATDIDKDVVVVGNTGYFEVWDAKRYEAQDDDTDLGVLFG